MTVLAYLHGFQSSPKSHKGELLAQACAQQGITLLRPQIPDLPGEAKAMLETFVASEKPTGLIGSSLGGYYATYLSERFALPAVLVNPAVRPYELLEDFLGPQQNPYTGHQYTLTPEHMQALRDLDVPNLSLSIPRWLLQQTEDEVLDFRQAAQKYQQHHCTIETGGNHAFVDFDRYCQAIIAFLQGDPSFTKA
ncbi:hypothetical protein VST7929_02322 [Vibrio stylophorae]|uniref:Esterase YqiA n=1 Tax=Vibrio stylophorae TaxID=659351 RepID=A0ABN8DTI1_9VIBR|nr:YqiA/YcfP family alpha/beta fold hydrolase [Vibrio stylophorae]CAH0534391.1 hypothetical protein VST7929_02322 [Vibrio stylophorae]